MVKEGDWVAVFHSVHRVLKAEQVLKEAGIAFTLIPAPRQFSADCGLALCFAPDVHARISATLEGAGVSIAELWAMQAGKYVRIV
ncbi:putative Se/S carrier-like protein [Pelovirga terrestris]|uniref:DUF3343 domain-containing protein n=1 Tax=Pelovirga terrestris TaxID=2771352 RepID=A0A8J6R5D6_9BACT|nr:DUF3343 domain-containing protein [Pelovirga terrestris]